MLDECSASDDRRGPFIHALVRRSGTFASFCRCKHWGGELRLLGWPRSRGSTAVWSPFRLRYRRSGPGRVHQPALLVSWKVKCLPTYAPGLLVVMIRPVTMVAGGCIGNGMNLHTQVAQGREVDEVDYHVLNGGLGWG